MRTRRPNSSMHRAETSASVQTPLVLCIFTASPREIKIYCIAWLSPQNHSPGVLQPAWPGSREHRLPARSTAQRPCGNCHCKGQGSAGTPLQTGGWLGGHAWAAGPTTASPPRASHPNGTRGSSNAHGLACSRARAAWKPQARTVNH